MQKCKKCKKRYAMYDATLCKKCYKEFKAIEEDIDFLHEIEFKETLDIDQESAIIKD